MLFARRDPLKLGSRLRSWLWPSSGVRRSAKYQFRRLMRLSGSPYAVAMGCAAGTFASFTPLIGFHFAIAFAIAWLLRGNLLAAAIGTAVGNPLTFPLIWASTFAIGQRMIPGIDPAPPSTLEVSLENRSAWEIWPVIKPMLLGSVPLGLAASLLVFLLVYRITSGLKQAREARLRSRRDANISSGAG
jgi:uncharacterized protein (DUF2062 family)